MLLGSADPEARNILGARTAGEAMSAPVVSIRPEQEISAAARKMMANHVNRLPVVDESEKVVGVVARADLVRAFTRTDADIAREITEDVIRRALWIEPDRVDVAVTNGEVALSGVLDTRDEAELLGRLTERVLGVVPVTADLSWEAEREPAKDSLRMSLGRPQ